jgi:putative transcriptional regulator
MPTVRRLLFGLVAVLLPAALVHAALPKLSLDPETPTLTGRVLIASTSIGDPRFARTVILMVRHGKDGALGITINRPVGERPLASLLEPLGDKNLEKAGNVRIFAGGPVEQQMGFVVHSVDYQHAETMGINGELAATANADILRDMARGKGPQKALVAFGYAGWASGQLEAELARKDWLIATADEALVFDEPRDRVWDAAMERHSREP